MANRERVRSTHALILRRRDLYDADRLLTVLTPGEGKLELLARGVRKTTSQKAGHLELFTHAALVIAQGRTWDVVGEVQTVESFRHLRQNLEAIAAASYLCELLDSFTRDGEDAHAIWDLALLVLRLLDEAAAVVPVPPPSLLAWFTLRLLGLAGFQPQFFHCLGCGQPLAPGVNYLVLSEGGVLCARCGVQRSDGELLDVDALKVLRFLQSRPWGTVAPVAVRPPVLRRVEQVLNRYVILVLERQLRSTLFLRRLATVRDVAVRDLPVEEEGDENAHS
ncbi:MAG: DNA repair protein RecO [Caldilinea sp.]